MTADLLQAALVGSVIGVLPSVAGIGALLTLSLPLRRSGRLQTAAMWMP